MKEKEPTVEELLIKFFKDSSNIIRKTLKEVREKYPELFKEES